MIDIQRINSMTENLEQFIASTKPEQEVDLHIQSFSNFVSHFQGLINSRQYDSHECAVDSFKRRVQNYSTVIEALNKIRANEKDVILNMRAYNAAKELFNQVVEELKGEFEQSPIERQNQLVQDFILPHNIVFRYISKRTPIRSELIR